ncbi:hypothetical protein M0813_15033 [Anaeramoeba flamelloides]|uniref:BTB domain-containing protein n=1 Tax=Anaeramoeba flamelloides TaxID=1746091 RepID=A0ABQ8Z3B3_9EUKA|nr:hypothetical protein M0813_15033 [Anaeramoeba flamelloides]
MNQRNQRNQRNQKQTQIFYSARKNLQINSLFNEKENQLQNWTQLSKIKNANQVRKIVSGCNKHCLIWKGTNNLEFYQTNQEDPKCFTIENEEIQDIQSGIWTYLILTKSGKVFSLAQHEKSRYCEIPLSDPESSTFEQIRPVPFFNKKENNRKVESLAMVGCSNYFLCKDGKLYGNGLNKGSLGDGTSNQAKNLPVFIFKDVTRVFGGVHGLCVFFTSKNNELYVCGENRGGCLGIGNSSSKPNSPVQVPNWKADDILDIHTNDGFSILITKEGKTYSCGGSFNNGFSQDKSTFTEIEELKNQKVIQYSGGYEFSLCLTNENELYGWGFRPDFQPTNQYGKIALLTPKKLNLPKYFQNNPSIKLKITCGTHSIFIYPSYRNCLIQDFQKLFKSKLFCDSKLKLNENFELPIHKTLVESRTNLQISTIEDLLNQESFSKEEILIFFKWLYLDQISNQETLKKIFNSLNLSFPPKNSFQKDLLNLYKDEDSKDFTLLIKNENDEDVKKDKEEEEEEEEEYAMTEIPVHKIVLIARSGLFRDMFQNVTQETNSVKDYSGKSIDSLEILIKYFYTDKIEITADHDPLLVLEELEDSIEYYQLNENSNILNQLNEIKNKL